MIGSLQGVCETYVCEVSRCGDGFVVAPEQCDSGIVANPHACHDDRDFYEETAPGCNDDCTYDYSTCAGYCGDGIINGSELCDGAPPEASCVDVGYAAGTLGCSQCGPGLDDCKFLNWTSHVSTSQLFGVRGANDRDVFAVGSGGVITHYNGSAWSEIDVSPCVLASHADQFVGVYALGNGKALAAGGEAVIGSGDPQYNDSILFAIDGTSCTRILVSTGTHTLDDVWQFSATNIWAVGQGIFHFDGTSWVQSNSSLNLRTLWASGPNDIYASGPSGLWHFNGTTWAASAVVSTSGYGVAGFSATDVYFAGDAGVEHWNGAAWGAPVPGATPGILGLSANSTHLFAATYNGAYVLDGSGWTSLAMPPYDVLFLDGIWASATGSVYATTGNRVARYPGGALTTSIYADLPTGEPGMSIAIADPSKLYALTNNGFYIYDGATWTSVLASSNRPYGTYTDMWRSPTGSLYFSRYSGAGNTIMIWNGTWSESVNIDDSFTLWGTSDDDIWIPSGAFPTVLQHFTHDSLGAAEIDATYTPGGTYAALWGSSSSDVFAIGGGGAIVHWNGSGWSAMTSGTTANLSSIWGSAANDVYVTGKGVFLHFDGATWSPLPAPIGTPFLRTLWGTAGNDLFVATTEGLYHYDGVRWSPVRTTLTSDIEAINGAGDAIYMLDDNSTIVRIVRTVSWSAP